MVLAMTTPPHVLFLQTVLCDVVTWEWLSAVATPLHILFYGLYFVMYSPPVSRSNHYFIVWSLHENDLWFQAVSVYCQLSDLLPRAMPHLIVVVWNQSRFWNQGTLAAWFLQQLLTLAMYTKPSVIWRCFSPSSILVKLETLHTLMRQFVGWKGSKTRLCQHMNTFSSFALWTFPALLVSDIISWSFYHRDTTSRIVHIW